MTPPRHLFVLTEATLPLFLWLIVTGKPVLLLNVQPWLPPLIRLLDPIAQWALRTGRARLAVDLAPEWLPYWKYDRRFFFQAVYERYEPWQDRHFGFADIADDAYGMGYKLVTANYLWPFVAPMHVLDAVLRRHPDIAAHGVPADLLDLCRAHLGGDAAPGARPARVPQRWLNRLVALAVCVYAVAWIVLRTRWKVAAETVFLAADYINDPRDFPLYEEASEGGEVMLVLRNETAFGAMHPDSAAYRHGTLTDGRFDLAGAVEAIRQVIGDTRTLLARHGNRLPPLFWRIATMPWRRIAIRALLNRYRPHFFWGRDDYNVEHILRREEMHRIGGQSLGVTHAMMTVFCDLMPQWRYVSFDTYYVNALPLTHPYFSRWAKDMRLVNTGSFGWKRSDLKESWPQGDDILVAIRVAWWAPETARAIQAIARRFPDRKVLLQFKRVYLSATEEADLLAQLSGGLPNVHYVTDNIYALLRRARFLVSDQSTLVQEAIEVGVCTFLLDVIDMAHSGFRELDGLCVSTAEELADRMEAADDDFGAERRLGFLKAMGLENSPMFYDLVRSDLGLPIKDPNFRYGGIRS